jgi:hypothetical protein
VYAEVEFGTAKSSCVGRIDGCDERRRSIAVPEASVPAHSVGRIYGCHAGGRGTAVGEVEESGGVSRTSSYELMSGFQLGMVLYSRELERSSEGLDVRFSNELLIEIVARYSQNRRVWSG